MAKKGLEQAKLFSWDRASNIIIEGLKEYDMYKEML